MTRLELVEYRLDYLLSQYQEKKSEPGFMLQLSLLASERHRLLGHQKTPAITPPLA